MDVVPEQERPRVDCKKSLFMQSSQDTPPDAASTQHEQGEGRRESVLSPTTLGAVVRGAMQDSQPLAKKKHRKRPLRRASAADKAAKASSSKSAPPTDFADRVPMKGAALIQVASEPILPPKPLEGISGDLRRLHDHVLSTEKSLLASKDLGFMRFVCLRASATSTRFPRKCFSCGLITSLRCFS